MTQRTTSSLSGLRKVKPISHPTPFYSICSASLHQAHCNAKENDAGKAGDQLARANDVLQHLPTPTPTATPPPPPPSPQPQSPSPPPPPPPPPPPAPAPAPAPAPPTTPPPATTTTHHQQHHHQQQQQQQQQQSISRTFSIAVVVKTTCFAVCNVRLTFHKQDLSRQMKKDCIASCAHLMKSPMQLRVCAKASPSCSLDSSWRVESKLKFHPQVQKKCHLCIKSSILINLALSGLSATPRNSKPFCKKTMKSCGCWGKKIQRMVQRFQYLSDMAISICLSERRMRINLLT